jgi:hypothetical protein
MNQKAFDLAQKFDSQGQRTVGKWLLRLCLNAALNVITGVLTKTDRIPRGDHDRWVPIVRNEDNTLFHGWFAVRQPDTEDIERGITWEEARAQENSFFEQTSPWAGLDPKDRQKLGTENLMRCLSRILSNLIARRYVSSTMLILSLNSLD